MELDELLMSIPINPNNFPAKLWHLVNNPCYRSISWDSTGDGIIIDQQLFQSELLCPSKEMNEANELFKTSNFTSFIRQLNLYGFRKLHVGSGTNASELGGGDGNIHHFYNDNFRKGRPDLLLKLKRLTSSNKAKLAAGLEVSSRPPNRFQRMLTSSLAEQSTEDCQGLIPVEETPRTCRSENVSPYPNVKSPSHNRVTFPKKELQCTPIPPRTWSNSFGFQQRHLASHSSFPGMFYPLVPHFPADITYTMQSTATSVHVQQGHHATMPGSMQRYSSYIPHPAQYAQPYYPSAIIPCSTAPAHLHPAVSLYQHCGYFQSHPVQPSFPMEVVHTNWSSSDLDELRREEMNLESVFQEELQSSPQIEMMKLDTSEVIVKQPAASPLQDDNGMAAVSPGNREAYCNPTRQLESLLPVNPDIINEDLFVDLPGHCQSPLTGTYVYPPNSDNTEIDITTCSDVDETLSVDKVYSLASGVTSPSLIELNECKGNTGGTSKSEKSADLTLLVEVACNHVSSPEEEE